MFKIIYHEKVVQRDIPALPKTMRERIRRAIDERLKTDPVSYGKPLRFSLKGSWRLRVGDYRIVYSIDPDDRLVIIKAIDHRRDIYQDF